MALPAIRRRRSSTARSLAVGPLGLALAVCLGCGSTHGSPGDLGASDAGTDAAPADGGPPPPVVRVDRVAGLGGPGITGLLHLGVDGEHWFGAGGKTEAIQPSGPELRGLEEPQVILGWAPAPGEPYRWLAHDADGVRWLGEGDGAWWFHVDPAGESPLFAGEPVTEPTFVRWDPRAAGTLTRFPTSPGLGVTALGPAGDGRLWVMADAVGATVVDGAPLGDEGALVAFFAALGEGGLADVAPFGTGAWRGGDPLLLPDGHVMVSTDLLPGEEHTLFGEAVGPGGVLARIDPAGPSLVRTWPVSHAGRLSVTEGAVQLDVGFRLTEVVLGDHTYEPLRDSPTPFEQSFVRIRWDGTGLLPEGERWPTDPSLVAEGGLQWRGPHGSELLLRVDADRRIDRRLSIPMGSGDLRPIDERRLFGVLFAGDGAGALMEEADGEASQQILEPVQPGHRTLWALELDRGSWEILRQRAFDLGPSEGETSALLQRLGDGHLLLGIRREGGLEDAVLEIHRWDGGEPARIPVDVTGTACRAHVDSIHTWEDDERVSFEGAGFQVVARCETGPHEVTIAGRSFTYDAANSASWFRIEVAE